MLQPFLLQVTFAEPETDLPVLSFFTVSFALTNASLNAVESPLSVFQAVSV